MNDLPGNSSRTSREYCIGVVLYMSFVFLQRFELSGTGAAQAFLQDYPLYYVFNTCQVG